MQYDYYIADVFTTRVFQGAQIAVFPFADGLNKSTMQRIAKEMNISETVFVFAEDRTSNKRRLRIFSPLGEVDFGGHPIIATGWVLGTIGDVRLESIHTPLLLEQNVGVINCFISAEDGMPSMITFSMPVKAEIDHFVPPEDELADILKLSAADLDAGKLKPLLVSCGKNYLIIPIKNYPAVRKAKFDFIAWSVSSAPATLAREILLVTPTPGAGKPDFHGRLVGPEISHTEDLPIGSAMPAFTAYLCHHDHIKHGTHIFSIDRGMESTRHSVLNIEMDNKPENIVVRVGGPAVLVSKGLMNIPD